MKIYLRVCNETGSPGWQRSGHQRSAEAGVRPSEAPGRHRDWIPTVRAKTVQNLEDQRRGRAPRRGCAEELGLAERHKIRAHARCRRRLLLLLCARVRPFEAWFDRDGLMVPCLLVLVVDLASWATKHIIHIKNSWKSWAGHGPVGPSRSSAPG